MSLRFTGFGTEKVDNLGRSRKRKEKLELNENQDLTGNTNLAIEVEKII